MKITDEEKRVLRYLSFGCYHSPRYSNLNHILETQFVTSTPPAETFDLLGEELMKVDKTSNYDYYEFLIAQLSCLQALDGRYDEALSTLTKNLSVFKSIKTIYLYVTYLVKLGDDNTLKKVASVLSANFVKYPEESNVLERYYLPLLFDQLYPLCGNLSFENLNTLFNNNYNLVISLVSYFQFKHDKSLLKELQAYIASFSSKFAKYHFPKADEINDEIENFIFTVGKNNDLYSILPIHSIKELITQSFSKTYQNLVILKQYIIILIIEGKKEYVEPSFDVYVEYIEKSKGQHNDQYPDLLDIIDTFTKVLNFYTSFSNQSDIAFIERTSSKLREFLIILSEDLDVSYNNDGLGCLSSKLAAIPLFSSSIAKGWFALGMSFKFFSIHRSTTTNELQTYLSKAVVFFQNCLYTNQEIIPNHYFQFALIYAKLNKLKSAVKLMKLCCFHEKENFKYWNFLILLYSTEENYKNAEVLVNNSIMLLNSKLEEELYVSRLTLEEKYEILELKMTQISLIELMNKDPSISLECLPELFLVYNKIFHTAETESNADHAPLSRTTSSRSKKSNPLKRMLTRPSNAQIKRSSLVPKASVKTGKQVEDRLLQKIWLWSANLFLKASLYDEAENCLIEAENCYQVNSSTHAKFGMLLLYTGRLKLSLHEFETAIESNDSNLEALLGLSKLILTMKGDAQIFVNESDKQAAELRLRILLEKVRHSYKYCQTTEIFWYLSILYEEYQDLDELQSCLWKCVELEENKPVRSFDCLEGLFHNI